MYSTSGLVTGEGIAVKPRLWTRADLRNKTRNILTLKQLFATANDECHFENLKRQIPKSKKRIYFLEMLSSGSTIGSQFATQSSSYSNAGLEVEYANDPASGGFFQTDYKK